MQPHYRLCIEKLYEQIQDSEAADHLARNIEVLVKVEERRAKLLGVDAPERVEAIVTEITHEDSRSPSWCGRLKSRLR